jgi:hypothetical protein
MPQVLEPKLFLNALSARKGIIAIQEHRKPAPKEHTRIVYKSRVWSMFQEQRGVALPAPPDTSVQQMRQSILSLVLLATIPLLELRPV